MVPLEGEVCLVRREGFVDPGTSIKSLPFRRESLIRLEASTKSLVTNFVSKMSKINNNATAISSLKAHYFFFNCNSLVNLRNGMLSKRKAVPGENGPFREDKCLNRRENQCFIVLLSGALFQPHRRRDILSSMSITKRVFKGVEIFDQRGTYWYDKYDDSFREIRHPGLKLSLVLRFRINCVLQRFGRQTSSLLNANCKKALNLLKKGLLIQGEAKTTSKRRVSRRTTDCLHGQNDYEHLKMEMEIPCSNKIKFITACSFSNDSFEDIMKAQISVIKASATLNIQAFKIKKSVSISF
ncbi:hypothetical protein Tco_0478382 [Tanacetum coccineum]